MLDSPTSVQSGSGKNKMLMPEPVRYRNAPLPDWETGCRNADASGINIWPYCSSTWQGGRMTVKWYPRVSIFWNLESSVSPVTVLRSNRAVFCLGFFGIRFWIIAHWHGSSPFSSLIIVIFSSSSSNLTTCFNPGVKVSYFVFSNWHDFAKLLQQFPQWNFRLKASTSLAVVFVLIFVLCIL